MDDDGERVALSGLDPRRREEPSLDLPLHLGVDLPVAPTAVGDLENLAEDGGIDQADAHAD